MRKLRRQSRVEEVFRKNNREVAEEARRKREERNESVNKALTERYESVNKALTKKEEGITKKESVNKALTERYQERYQERYESVNKVLTERYQKHEISELSTKEEILLKYLFEICSSLGQRETPRITNHEIANFLQTTSGSSRVILSRIKKKGFLKVIKSKNGPSGWRVFELPEFTYRHFANQKNITRALQERDQSVNKALTKALTGPLTNGPSSSSIINNKKTTTTKEQENDDWVHEVQIPDILKEKGFGLSHLKQMKNNKNFSFSTEEIIRNLEAFAFDLNNGHLEEKKIASATAFFFGALNKGGYNSLAEDFKTSEEQGEDLMIELHRKKNKEKEERKKELENVLFESWLGEQTEKRIREIDKPLGDYLGTLHKANLKDYFLKNEFDHFKKGQQDLFQRDLH